MSVAYVDTSVLVAIEFDEQHAEVLDKRLSQHSIVSSMLMEAGLSVRMRAKIICLQIIDSRRLTGFCLIAH